MVTATPLAQATVRVTLLLLRSASGAVGSTPIHPSSVLRTPASAISHAVVRMTPSTSAFRDSFAPLLSGALTPARAAT